MWSLVPVTARGDLLRARSGTNGGNIFGEFY